MFDVDYTDLPEHMREGMRLYIEEGIEPGGFATAVLRNDLVGALRRADQTNSARIHDWARWLWNECPSPAWGSESKVKAWMAERRAAKKAELERVRVGAANRKG